MKAQVAMIMAGAGIALHAMDGADKQLVQRVAVTVLLYDHAAFSHGAIRSLEEQTNRIMSQVGVRLKWVQCAGLHVDLPPKECSNELGPEHVVFSLLASCPKRSTKLHDHLGYAVLYDQTAFVCADRVRAIEVDDWLERTSVLPYAAAHEIGHLLLGSGHSASGIMRAVWRKQELFAIQRGDLHFSADQADRMHMGH